MSSDPSGHTEIQRFPLQVNIGILWRSVAMCQRCVDIPASANPGDSEEAYAFDSFR